MYLLDWPQWSDYAIDDTVAEPLIYPTGAPKTPRHITSGMDELNAFATVATKADGTAALLEFVREFGLLGYSVLAGSVRVPGAPPIALPPRAATARPRRSPPSLPGDRLRMADPVLWVRRHARNVQRILQLRGSLGLDLDRLLTTFDSRAVCVTGRATKAERRHPDDGTSRHRWRAGSAESWGPRVRLSTRPTITVPLLNPPWTAVLRDLAEEEGLMTGPGQLARSRRIIKALLDPNLGDVARVYDSTTGDSPFRFRALIQVIYWQLADRLSSGEGPRQCRCGGWWIPTDNRQQDHPACYMKFYMQDKRKHERGSKRPYRRKRSRGGRR